MSSYNMKMMNNNSNYKEEGMSELRENRGSEAQSLPKHNYNSHKKPILLSKDSIYQIISHV